MIILIFSLFNTANLQAKVRGQVSFKKDRNVSSLTSKKKNKTIHNHRKRPSLERTVPEINILK